MVTLSEIIRWLIYRVENLYHVLVVRAMRRDQLLVGSERKFRALLEAAPDAIVIVNEHGHIALINAQAEKLFGYPREELLGQGINILVPERLRDRHREHPRAYFQDAKARPMGGGLELYGRRRDCSEFPVEISLSPLETDEGLVLGGRRIRLSVSIGVAGFEKGSVATKDVMMSADLALYAAKEAGRNRSACTSPTRTRPAAT